MLKLINEDPSDPGTPGPRPGDTGLDLVTGAFSYSGSRIARQLLAEGRKVRSLTRHAQAGSEGSGIDAQPLDFDDLPGLTRSLTGVTTFYNTYWVRVAGRGVDHSLAALRCRTLFEAAARAGVTKIVHVSVLNPSLTSPFPYFRGKAEAERSLIELGVPFAVLRPAMLFDEEGALINNMAWMLRRLPVFGVGGDGRYRVRPTHVEDLARLAVKASAWPDDRVVDAVGPERPTFLELVHQVRAAVASRALVLKVPPPALVVTSKLLGMALRDVVLTSEEYYSTAEGLADSESPSSGDTKLSSWLETHGAQLGRHYANQTNRHRS